MIARIDTVKPYIQSLYNIDLRGFAHKKNFSVDQRNTKRSFQVACVFCVALSNKIETIYDYCSGISLLDFHRSWPNPCQTPY